MGGQVWRVVWRVWIGLHSGIEDRSSYTGSGDIQQKESYYFPLGAALADLIIPLRAFSSGLS